MTSKARHTIVVTDSGLGGVSVVADLYNRLVADSWRSSGGDIEIVFHDAFPESLVGYNEMEDMQERARAFDEILEAIEATYRPDSIAIACNTLSAIYPHTAHSRDAATTFEIVACGRRQLARFKDAHPGLPIVIVATAVTLGLGVYPAHDAGLFQISGENLATLVEVDDDGQRARNRIREIFSRIRSLAIGGKELALFLGCTHYGFAREAFRSEAREAGLEVISFIDPNRELAETLASSLAASFSGSGRVDATVNQNSSTVGLRIGLLTGIDPAQRRRLSQLIDDPSGEVKKALIAYGRSGRGTPT